MDKFFIMSRGAGYDVIEINAKTLRGAKATASRYFSEAIGNSLEVLVKDGPDFETIACKPAFERWVDI